MKKISDIQQGWLDKHHKTYPVLCKMCPTEVKWRNVATGGQFNTYCSASCAKQDKLSQQAKQKQTMVKRYGVENPMQSAQLKDKAAATNLIRYGTKNPMSSDLIQQKQKQTMIERYGVEYAAQSASGKVNTVATNLKKYGVHHSSQSPIVRQKRNNTCMIKYGTVFPVQTKQVQDAITSTHMKKYGVIRASQTQEIKNKRANNNILKYGVKHASQQHMVDILPLIEDYNWLFDQYITQNKTATQIASELDVITYGTILSHLRHYEIEIRQYFWSSYKCQLWLTQQDYEIISEWKIPSTRYRADGYCEETNTIYEFHGDYWHGNPIIYPPNEINEVNGKSMGELYQKTIERENLIKSLGYNLVVMWESDFVGHYLHLLEIAWTKEQIGY
jgi:hypothetical protein